MDNTDWDEVQRRGREFLREYNELCARHNCMVKDSPEWDYPEVHVYQEDFPALVLTEETAQIGVATSKGVYSADTFEYQAEMGNIANTPECRKAFNLAQKKSHEHFTRLLEKVLGYVDNGEEE